MCWEKIGFKELGGITTAKKWIRNKARIPVKLQGPLLGMSPLWMQHSAFGCCYENDTPSSQTLGICCSAVLNFCNLHLIELQLPAASFPGKWDHLNVCFLWALSYCSAKHRIIHTGIYPPPFPGIKPTELNSGPVRGDANPPGSNGFLPQVNLTNYFHKTEWGKDLRVDICCWFSMWPRERTGWLQGDKAIRH